MTAQTHGRPVSGLDRGWTGLRSVAVLVGVQTPDTDAIRELLRRWLLARSGTPWASTLDTAGTRWLPVPPDRLAAHLERVVQPGPDLSSLPSERVDELTTDAVEGHPSDLPFRFLTGPATFVYSGTHMLGDATSSAALLRAVLDLDLDRLLRLTRVDTATLRSGFAAQARLHGRAWAEIAGRGVAAAVRRRPPSESAVGGATDRRTTSSRSEMVTAVVTTAGLKEISRWRNEVASGTTLTAAMAALTHRALTRAGVDMDSRGLFTLVDLRRFLETARGDDPLSGNLAKSVYLPCDATDPRAVDAALATTMATARPFAAAVLGSVADRLRTPAPPGPSTGAPLVLTYNSVPGLPGTAGLPWLPDAPTRRYIPGGHPVWGDGISVIALRLREHLEISATLAADTVDPAVVREAMRTLPDLVRDLRR